MKTQLLKLSRKYTNPMTGERGRIFRICGSDITLYSSKRGAGGLSWRVVWFPWRLVCSWSVQVFGKDPTKFESIRLRAVIAECLKPANHYYLPEGSAFVLRQFA